MKITVSKSDLDNALKVAGISLASSSDDLSSHYVFRKTDSGVEVLTYNQRVCSAYPLPCEVSGAETGDTFSVDGWRISQWVAGVGDVPLTLHLESPGVLKLISPRSTVRVRSMDTASFPYWDQTLESAESKAEISAVRLASVLGYARHFVYSGDDKPEMSQVTMMGGSMVAACFEAISRIQVPGLEDSELQVVLSDIGSVVRFLSHKNTEKVTVLEHKRTTFFRRQDGALLGVARPSLQFPEIKTDVLSEPSSVSWTLRTEDILAGLQCLKASAEKDNTILALSYDLDQNKVVMGVNSMAGGEDVYPLEATNTMGMDQLPETGIRFSYPHLQKVIGHFGKETISFNAIPVKKGQAWVLVLSHKAEDEGSYDDEYQTVLLCKR